MMEPVASLTEPHGGNPPSLDFVQFARVVFDHWRVMILLPMALAILASIVSLVLPKYYMARVMFLPERESELPLGNPALTGLASQFGVQLGEGGSQSPRFYADLASSREILERLLWTEVPSRREEGTRPLIDWVQPPSDDSVRRVEKAVKRLGKHIRVNSDLQTGTVRMDVETRDPVVAAAAANHLVQYFNEFNVVTRRSRGGEQRRFVQGRYEEVAVELAAAEQLVTQFLERNRLYESSPELVFEYEQLQRKVGLTHELFRTLARELESARIDEVNDTPVLTIIDNATSPVKRSRPRRTLTVISVALFGVVIALCYVFLAENVQRRMAAGDPNAAVLREYWRRFQTRLSMAWRKR
jgi:uncharacterized protein involved in exopolysaccharide biosynthesis